MDTEISPGAASNPLRFVFFNDRGLRAGWRLLIFLLIVLGIPQHCPLHPQPDGETFARRSASQFHSAVADNRLHLCLLVGAPRFLDHEPD